jgi:hypothetical protein
VQDGLTHGPVLALGRPCAQSTQAYLWADEGRSCCLLRARNDDGSCRVMSCRMPFSQSSSGLLLIDSALWSVAAFAEGSNSLSPTKCRTLIFVEEFSAVGGGDRGHWTAPFCMIRWLCAVFRK